MTCALMEKFQVQNTLGIHARPAAKIAKLLRSFESSVTFSLGTKCADAKQVMELLLLEAQSLSFIEVNAQGVDAIEAIAELKELFESGFGEEKIC